jgi:hypothetical protein
MSFTLCEHELILVNNEIKAHSSLQKKHSADIDHKNDTISVNVNGFPSHQ